MPFLFSIKQLNAKGPADAFGGDFVVPSYRGSTFLDPKVGMRRGAGGAACAKDARGGGSRAASARLAVR